jgi:hypothetical protein
MASSSFSGLERSNVLRFSEASGPRTKLPARGWERVKKGLGFGGRGWGEARRRGAGTRSVGGGGVTHDSWRGIVKSQRKREEAIEAGRCL